MNKKPDERPDAENSLSSSDLVVQFVEATANKHTRRSRQTDLLAFEQTMDNEGLGQSRFLDGFLAMDQAQAANYLEEYKSRLLNSRLSQGTINRRLATLRSFIKFARARAATSIHTGRLVKSMYVPTKIEFIREHNCQQLIAIADPGKTRGLRFLHGVRDVAMLSLLCEVPLTGGQLCALKVGDFSRRSHRLRIPLSSGAAEDSNIPEIWVPLLRGTCDRISRYLKRARHHTQMDAPLIRSIDRRPEYSGNHLNPESLLKIVRQYGVQIGHPQLSSQILRCTAIIRALYRTNGNVADAMEMFPYISKGVWEYYLRYYRDYGDDP